MSLHWEVFCFPFFSNLYMLHSLLLKNKVLQTQQKPLRSHDRSLGATVLKLPVHCARPVLIFFYKRKQCLSCQRKKLVRVYAYKLLYSLYWCVPSAYTKTVCECRTCCRFDVAILWTKSCTSAHAQQTRAAWTQSLHTTFPNECVRGVCVLPICFPISDNDPNVPWTLLVSVLQQSKPASLNICSAVLKTCLNDCIILGGKKKKSTNCLQNKNQNTRNYFWPCAHTHTRSSIKSVSFRVLAQVPLRFSPSACWDSFQLPMTLNGYRTNEYIISINT